MSSGLTKVLCTVCITDGVPQWLKGKGQGWVTAEYSMLPGSTRYRKPRERGPRFDGRSMEIQRLIGRTLRSAIDLKKLPEVTLWVDCDVLVADGGTRTASINGASVAVHDAITKLQKDGRIKEWPMVGMATAISVGVVNGEVLVDLDYKEDSAADVDMNVACLSDGRLVEVQGSAEGSPFTDDQCNEMIRQARAACLDVHEQQQGALKS